MLQPQRSGSVDVVSNRNPSLSAQHCRLAHRGVPRPLTICTCFVCTWNMIWLRRDTMKAQCGPSSALWRLLLHFLTLPVPILAWLGTAQQSYGPDAWLDSREVVREGERYGGRASSLGPPEGFSCSLSLIQAARRCHFTICSVCLVFPFWYWPLCVIKWWVGGFDRF